MSAPKLPILPLRRLASTGGNGTRPEGCNASQKLAYRKRASHVKTKTGCLTCRIRKVKCDEASPACKRCTSTGRKCDGYEVPPPKPMSLSIEASVEELRGLEFFYTKTASSLSLFFDEEFWTQTVLHMSSREPAIRHTVAAIGILQSGRLEPSAYKGALLQYNRAIKAVSARTPSENTTGLILVACLLFVCFEFLQGDVNRAFKHSYAGVRIAMSCHSPNGAGLEVEPVVRRQVLPMFYRLVLLGTQYSNETSFVYPVTLEDSVPGVFTSVQGAGGSIVDLMNHCNAFMREIRARSARRQLTPDDYEAHSVLLERLNDWAITADKMVLSLPMRESDLCAARILRLHHIVITIWLSKSLIPEECAYDDFMSEFETAISLAEAIRSSIGYQMDRERFSFNPDHLHPTYHIATKCRHPGIRRRAVHILRAANRREAFWDSRVCTAIAQRVMDIEESSLCGAELPAERYRVHSIKLDSEIARSPGKHKATFYMKPKGFSGPWMVWTEVLKIEAELCRHHTDVRNTCSTLDDYARSANVERVRQPSLVGRVEWHDNIEVQSTICR